MKLYLLLSWAKLLDSCVSWCPDRSRVISCFKLPISSRRRVKVIDFARRVCKDGNKSTCDGISSIGFKEMSISCKEVGNVGGRTMRLLLDTLRAVRCLALAIPFGRWSSLFLERSSNCSEGNCRKMSSGISLRTLLLKLSLKNSPDGKWNSPIEVLMHNCAFSVNY